MKCKVCGATAAVGLRSHNAAFCEKCYLDFFRRQVSKGIEQQKLFGKSEKVLVALSGGKDSLALMLELHEQGYDATGLFVHLGIPQSSDSAANFVENFCRRHQLKLKIAHLEQEGLAIPLVKKYIKRPICSVCGKIKRHYFNKIAVEGGYAALATGHNLDDETARLFSNTLRWDGAYLSSQGPLLQEAPGFARKVKPLWRLSEFETANYAFLRQIDHHLEPCPYSAGASFSVLKGIMQRLEHEMPGRKLDFYSGFLTKGRKIIQLPEEAERRELRNCPECGFPTSSQGLCGVCAIRKTIEEKKAGEGA